MKIEQKNHTPFELIENENGDLGIKTVIAEFTLEKDLRTTVAKAIDGRYQKIEDEITKLIEYGEQQIELYQNEVERIKNNEMLTEEAKVMGFRLAQGKFYGWRDSIKFLRKALNNNHMKEVIGVIGHVDHGKTVLIQAELNLKSTTETKTIQQIIDEEKLIPFHAPKEIPLIQLDFKDGRQLRRERRKKNRKK